MLYVKAIYKNKFSDVKCPNCPEEDTQSHLLSCDKLVNGTDIITEVPKYENIFGNKPGEIVKVTRIVCMSVLE